MSEYSQNLAKYCDDQRFLIPAAKGAIKLDDHQQEAMEMAAISLFCNERAFSIVHSCGSGKTYLEGNLLIASKRAKDSLEKTGDSQDIIVTTERALIYSVRDQLLDLGLDVGVWGLGGKSLDRPVILASIQALQKNADRLVKEIPPEKVAMLIGDEADLFLTEKRKEIIRKFPEAIKIGLTATPSWPDGRNIEELWGRKMHELKLKEGILKGVNVPPMFTLFEVNIDDQNIAVTDGDYDKKILDAALREAEIEKAVSEVYSSLIPERRRKDFPTLVFVPSVNLVGAVQDDLRKKFAAGGLNIAGWTGESTSSGQMQKEIIDFNKGNIDILVLCEMGGRGIDLPRARCLIDAYPTLSPNKLEQRHGRVLRRIRDTGQSGKSDFKKPFSLVAQIVPKSNKFRPYLLPDLLDCWPDFEQGRLLVERDSVERAYIAREGVGAPIQDEVNELKEHLLNSRPRFYVTKVEQVDIYGQLKLRAELPVANQDGFFELNGEIYGSKNAWSRELGIGYRALSLRMKGEVGMTAKSALGRIDHQYFAKSLIRKKCADLLNELPKAATDGFFMLDGRKYGTIAAWTRKAKRKSTKPIKAKLAGINGITGLDFSGQVITEGFYSEELILAKCGDYFKEIPQADETDMLHLEGKRYALVTAWGKRLGIPWALILSKLEGVKGVTGKNRKGILQVERFYEESLVLEKCADYLKSLPVANEDGFFELGGKKYGTRNVWMHKLGLKSTGGIDTRLRGIKGISGIVRGRVIEDGFYEEQLIVDKCSDLVDEFSVADEKGFFKVGNKTYGTVNAWIIRLGLSYNSVMKRMEGLIGITGIDPIGRVRQNSYYEEQEIYNAWKDLIVRKEK